MFDFHAACCFIEILHIPKRLTITILQIIDKIIRNQPDVGNKAPFNPRTYFKGY